MVQYPAAIKLDTPGGYNPPGDALSFLATLKVRQVRRLRFLTHLVWLHENQDHDNHRVPQMQQEWIAVLKAKGYSPSFPQWLVCNTHVRVCPQDVPCHAELAAIQKAVQEDCDIWHTRAMQLKRADYKSKIQTDFKENGGKLAFAAIREPANPPVDQIGYDEIFTATVLRLRTKESGVWVKIAEKHDLKLRQQLQSPYGTAFVHKISPRGIQLIGISPERCTFALTRKQWTCQPDLIGKKVAAYWNRFWQRDNDEKDNWQEAFDMIQKWAAHFEQLPVQENPLDNWKRAINKTKVNTATGSCGFCQAELAMLPDLAVERLIKIFDEIEPTQWPSCLIRAKVILLNKTMEGGESSQTRPITVFSLLYRTWAKSNSFAIYQAWERLLPKSIVGGIPGRQAWLEIQSQIEEAILDNRPQSGFVLDIQKAFNGIPRKPCAELMIRMGAPSKIIHQWMGALDLCERMLLVGSHCTPCGKSTTGAPEGCPISVLAMIAVSHLWSRYSCEEGSFTYVFADNWEWRAESPTINQKVYHKTHEFCRIWKQKLSMQKCWAWALDESNKRAWLSQ